MKHIEVVRTGVKIDEMLVEVLSREASTMWLSYGPLFKAFKYTETIRLIGPAESSNKQEMEDSLRNSLQFDTISNNAFPVILNWLNTNFTKIQRAALIKLLPAQKVLRHIDRGEWFKQTKRYHLCLQGAYRYEVGDEFINVEPGMVFTFDNQIEHGTFNLKNQDRITLMFDVAR